MRLFEIISNFMNQDILSTGAYSSDISEGKIIGKIDEYDISMKGKIGKDSEIVVLLLNSDKKPVGKFDLHKLSIEKTYRATSIKLLPEAQGRNIGYKLYVFLITEMNMMLSSGASQSRGAEKLYIKLANHPDIIAYGYNYRENKKFTQLSYDEVHDRLTGNLFDIYGDNNYQESIDAEIEEVENEINSANSDEEKEYLEDYLIQLYAELRNNSQAYDSSIILVKKSNMKLFEIVIEKSFTKNVESSWFDFDFNAILEKSPVIGKIDEYDIILDDGEYYASIILVNSKKQLVGVLEISNEGFKKSDNIYNIESINLLPEAQGRNIGYKLYAFLITKKNMTIISDEEQSEGSQKMYTKLANHPNITAYGIKKEDDYTPVVMLTKKSKKISEIISIIEKMGYEYDDLYIDNNDRLASKSFDMYI